MIENVLGLISSWENEKQSEHKIIENCIVLIQKNNYSCDYILAINDALRKKGYSYQFMSLAYNRSIIDSSFFDLTSQPTKSLQKTKDLITYLSKTNDFRVSFACLHCLKVQNLMILNFLPSNPFFESLKKENIYNAYFSNYQNNSEVQKHIEDFFNLIGIHYLSSSSFRFKMDMEYLLWTMNKKDHSKTLYIKQNTIRVAFNISPKEIFETKNKLYYEENIASFLVSYLKLIDKSAISFMKEKYKNIIEELDIDNGYKILFYTL